MLARTGHATNETVKILTLATVILLPGTLLAGILGMNFKVGLFAHTALFWVVLAVIAMIAVVTLAVAKAKDWI
jgi:magnesium transporter